MRSPRLRAVLAAVHWGRCTRFALPHASSITRESPGVVARFLPMFESKVLRRPAANYALKLRSCNGSRQHFPRLLRARHVDRSADVRQLGFHAPRGRWFRRRNRCVSVLDRDRTARPANAAFNGAFAHGRVRPPSFPVTSCAAATPCAMARLPRPLRSDAALEADVVRAGCPAGWAAFRTAKLRINADNPGSGTTTR